MTSAAASVLQGVGRIPRSKPAALAWLRKMGVKHRLDGQCLLFQVSSLPEPERRAWELRQIEAAGLPAGEYDDAAHDRFSEATPAMQAAALRKAEIARFLTAGGASEGRGLTCALMAQARERFGADGTDRMTLRRILRTSGPPASSGIKPIETQYQT